jgi:hypothetical protein
MGDKLGSQRWPFRLEGVAKIWEHAGAICVYTMYKRVWRRTSENSDQLEKPIDPPKEVQKS